MAEAHAQHGPCAAPSPEAVVAQVAARPGTVWLDGGDAGWSVLVWDPVEVVRAAEGWPAAGRRLTRPAPASELPFVSGCVGYVGYEAGAAVAPVPAARPTAEPPVWLGRYEGALLHHAASGRWEAVGAPEVRAAGARLLAEAGPLGPPPHPLPRPTRTVAREDYLAAIARVLALIAEGDCYQVNLSRVVEVEGIDDAWQAYRRLRAGSRPDRGAFLALDPALAVLSNSPERLLDVDGDEAVTEPVKGTRPRAADPARDAAAHRELEGSAKERAELTMIVDLCRNDLGRVAVPGSVQAEARRVTAHANVHHASQVVRARLAPGEDAWSALAALFPPGSVVGAPKVRAAQRIAELEPQPRGVYCGAIGFVSDHGRARWSVAIRSAVVHGRHARFHVGGGIVADSDPEAEWAETHAKGTLLQAALAGARPGPRGA
ncbi:MAG: anthranilate synthase component I family protein [Alphaproteobacteria bacterium]|nr:anthranilate synthase component I family protein [Alphaproteobacteria bacterium]